MLQVLNDDLVKPNAGFGAHPHRDAEIFSYIVDGQLSHEDSMGNRVRATFSTPFDHQLLS